jgi:hypothetical protein
MESMSQFQTQVPDPLAEDLPELLPTSHMRTPAIRILFLILIGEDGLKRPTMQVQLHDISGGEGTTGQCRKKEFVDDVVSSRSDSGGLARGGMGGHNDAARRARGSHLQSRKIEEGTLGPAFRMCDLRIRRGEQASLDGLLIQQMIVLAAHDVGESR